MTPGEIANALGGTFNGQWYNIPGPNHSSVDRSLGFRFDPAEVSGIRVYSFAGDDLEACRKHVLAKLNGLATPWAAETTKTAEFRGVSVNTSRAIRCWHQAVAPHGTPVQSYLQARACFPTSNLFMQSALRFHPACVMGSLIVPAMVALMRDAITGEPVGIHRTAIADDGLSKRILPNRLPTRMMLGRSKGTVVMVSPAAPTMGIAEGIETALSAQMLFGIPVWACLSADGVAEFPAISGLVNLTIFADHDEAGIQAAEKCAVRLHRKRVNGKVAFPQVCGDDWNSHIQRGG